MICGQGPSDEPFEHQGYAMLLLDGSLGDHNDEPEDGIELPENVRTPYDQAGPSGTEGRGVTLKQGPHRPHFGTKTHPVGQEVLRPPPDAKGEVGLRTHAGAPGPEVCGTQRGGNEGL